MRNQNKVARMIAAAAAAGVGISVAGAATSTETRDSAAAGVIIDEIVVTARRRTEDLQKTAVAITAIGGEALQRQGITTLQDAIIAVPGVDIKQTNRGGGFYIRGIGSRVAGNGSPVSAYTDGVFQSRPEVTNVAFSDVQRVEVLRGPQGTLYGRNANGGAVNIITHNPVLGAHEGSAKIQVGNYDALNAEGALNVPLGESAALRGVFTRDRHSGYLSNGLNDTDVTAGRVKFLAEPTDSLSILVGVRALHNGGNGNGNVYLPFDSRSDPWEAPSYAVLEFPPGSGNVTCDPCMAYQDTDNFGAYAQVDWDLGWGVATLLPAYQDFEAEYQQVFSGLYEYSHTPLEQQSTELRIASPVNAAVKWVGGVYWLRTDEAGNRGNNESFGAVGVTEKNLNKAAAVFGEVTFPITARLRLTGGARYTEDKLEQYSLNTTGAGTPNETTTILDVADSWSKATYKAGIETDLSQDSMLYAHVATGYKQGGVGQNNNQSYSFDPEEITAYELGIKNRFLDQRLQLNVGAYFYDYTNYQFDSYVTDPVTQIITTRTQNLPGSTDVYGVEIEGAWLATAADRFDFTAAYAHTSFADAIVIVDCEPGQTPNMGQFCELNLSGRPLPSSPELTATLAYSHRWDLAGGAALTGNVDGEYSSGYFVDLLRFNHSQQEAYTLWNARVSYDSPDKRWSLAAYGRNLSNEPVLVQANKAGPVNVLGVVSAPRTYGLVFSFNF